MMQIERFVGMKCFHYDKKIKKKEEIAATHSRNGKQQEVMCQKCALNKKTFDWGVSKK